MAVESLERSAGLRWFLRRDPAILASIMRPIKTLLLLVCLACPALGQNRVLDLDGQGSYVQLPGHIFDALDEATVEAWVRWEDWASFSQWFSFGAGDLVWDGDKPWKAMGMNHFDTSSTLQFFIYTDQPELHLVRLVTDLRLGQWCHMAAVSGRGGMRFYLNGVLVGHSGFEGSFAAMSPGSDNYLGKSSWQSNAYFRGQLDEVRVWSVARSEAQIRAGMVQRLRGGEESLVGLWNFDAGDARDVSPQGHEGRLRGSARCVAASFPGVGSVLRPAVVEGTVRGETGVPLENAVVRLRKADAEVLSMATRVDGRYALAVFGSGTYALDTDLENASLKYGRVVAVLEDGTLQWVPALDPRLQHASFQTREVLLEEGAALRLDLSAPASKVAGWRGEGDAHDAVGPHHGTLVGGAGFAPGLVGQAFNLDGVDDFIRVPHAPDLSLSGSFSLVAWIFPTAEDRHQMILSKWPLEAPFIHGEYEMSIEPGLRACLSVWDAVHSGLTSPTNVFTRNAWNQVIGVYDQATGTQRIYVNGVEVARLQDPSIAQNHSSVDLILGALVTFNTGAASGLFQGLIDEVSIYQRALADVSVQRLYGAHAEARWSGEGHANDARGANHGILVKGVEFAPGLVGQAFSFDGQENYVEFDHLIGNFGAGDFTLELWVWRPQERLVAEPLLVKSLDIPYFTRMSLSGLGGLMGNEVGNKLDLRLDAAGRVQAELNSGYDFNRLSSTRPLAVQQWHHLALVRQDREVRLYLDGQLDTLDAAIQVVDLALTAPLTLGAAPDQGRYFHGLIDEVAFHNRALSPAAIQATYETHLSAWRWRLWRGRLEKGGDRPGGAAGAVVERPLLRPAQSAAAA